MEDSSRLNKMKKTTWIALFVGALVLLIITNIYWMYQTVDTAVGHGYYKESCEKYEIDRDNFIHILESFENKDQIEGFLRKNNIDFDLIEKGNESILSVGSFQITCNQNGELIETNKF